MARGRGSLTSSSSNMMNAVRFNGSQSKLISSLGVSNLKRMVENSFLVNVKEFVHQKKL